MPMQYQIEWRADNTLRIHVHQRLVQGTTVFVEDSNADEFGTRFEEEVVNKEGVTNFCRMVGRLDGVEPEIVFSRHFITIKKGLVFSWGEILSHVLEALRINIAPDKQLEMVAPPEGSVAANILTLCTLPNKSKA